MIDNLVYRHVGAEPGEALPAFTSLGCYPCMYQTADGEVLCPDCANGKNGSEALTADAFDRQWHIVGGDVFWEGPAETCAHCGASIESAYGDPGPEGEK